jgi:hypothetical protein
MADANAIVEKMAGLGLRHGEKAGVAIATMVFLFCVGLAVSKPTINTTPEQVKKAAEVAKNNLDRKEDRDTIIKRLEEKDNIKPTNFAGSVEEQIKVKLVADNYKAKREWVSPEPGAGLIRDTPKLIAPSELYAYPGRGGLLVYALDEQGERKPAKEDEAKPRKQRYGAKPKRRGGAMGGGMGGMMGGARKKKKSKSKQELAREEKEETQRKERALKGLMVGEGGPKEAEKADEQADSGKYEEETKGYRWVAITGILDHGKMLANYREALKNPNLAHPQYMRLDVERRTLQPDGTWSSWQKVDADKNLDILDNLPAVEEELAPENVRPDGLVDPLPFLNAGLWEKVHIISLVPKEKAELPPEPKNQMGRGGMGYGGMGGLMGQMAQSQAAMQRGMMSQMQQNQSMMQGMGRMGMGMMGGMGGGSESAGNFWKSEETRVMVRALDFTAEPSQSYRYRVRIVVANPNRGREDVSPLAALDKDKKVLEGPWSKETDVVTMPPDVEPYLVRALPTNNPGVKRTVSFQVISFNHKDGWTVPRGFEAGVGDVIGDERRGDVPSSDGSGKQSTMIDFSTRHIVLDLDGGDYLKVPEALGNLAIERPAYAALLRRDGAMVVHNQADDFANEFRKDTEANYHHEIEQSDKERKSSRGSGYSRLMGGMMGGGMMGGGMR